VFDIWLYPPATNPFDIILSHGLRALRGFGWPLPPYKEEPVIAGSLYLSLVDRYGPAMGTQVFQKMYTERKGPFQEGAKYDAEKPSVVRKVQKAGGVLPGIGVLGRDIPLPWPKGQRPKRK
jgi:hypothetical protein